MINDIFQPVQPVQPVLIASVVLHPYCARITRFHRFYIQKGSICLAELERPHCDVIRMMISRATIPR
jgi:hypothetical protein